VGTKNPNTIEREVEVERVYDLEEREAAERAGGGGELGAERGDEPLAVAGVQLRGEPRWSESGGGRHAADQSNVQRGKTLLPARLTAEAGGTGAPAHP
jgi:hypothetical protein